MAGFSHAIQKDVCIRTHGKRAHETNTTRDDQKIGKDTIRTIVATCDLQPKAQQLVGSTPCTSRFYMLPKIHKPNSTGRPIVSACCCPTENIAAYLDEIMAPVVRFLATYVKDTNDALRIFDTLTFDGPNDNPRFRFTIDIKLFYTVIPKYGGFQALSHFFDQRANKEPPTHTLTRLTELVFTLNAFSFNAEYYHQIGGAAMGSKMGPSYACLYLGSIEEQI